MDVRTALFTTLSAAVLILTGCGGADPAATDGVGAEPTMSLEEYAQRDCAIGIETGERVRAVVDDTMSKIGDLSAMGE